MGVVCDLQVAYQKILELAYVDKLLQQVHLEFRDRFKNELGNGAYFKMNFSDDFEVTPLCTTAHM